MMQTWENCKRPNFGPDFEPKIVFLLLVSHCSNVPSYHPMQFKGKLTYQTWENGEKPNFGPNFGPFGPNSGSQFFFREIYFY